MEAPDKQTIVKYVVACVSHAVSLMCEDEVSKPNILPSLVAATSENEQVYRRKHAKVTNYYEFTIPQYLDDDFKAHFRLSRSTVKEICTLIKSKEGTYVSGCPEMDSEKRVLSSLWLLSNQESYRGVADRFGISKGHLHSAVESFCADICSLIQLFIKWPLASEMHQLSQEFSSLRGDYSFPGVIGCVDGSHIEIPKPSKDAQSYYNRKGYYSVNLQAICDSKFRFLDIFCGWPGSSGDSRVWQNSPIGKYLSKNQLPPEFHLLGDSAYPLQTYIMVPYKDYGNMTRIQKNFNVTLSSTRVIIEQAFGLLKNRFRRLSYLQVQKLCNIPKIVMTCCTLHNMCIGLGDCIDADIITLPPMLTEHSEQHNRSTTAATKRNNIAHQLILRF